MTNNNNELKTLAAELLDHVLLSPNKKKTVSLLSIYLVNRSTSTLFSSELDYDYLDKSPFFHTVNDATFFTLHENAVIELVENLIELNSSVQVDLLDVFSFNTLAKTLKAPIKKSLVKLLETARISISIK